MTTLDTLVDEHGRTCADEAGGIGPTDADIVLREVQDVWPWVGPYVDDKALAAAKDPGLPANAAELGDRARDGERAVPAAALVRHSLS